MPLPSQSGVYAVELEASISGQVPDTIKSPFFAPASGAVVPDLVRLQVTKTGAGNGAVTGSAIDCGETCAATYNYGTQLTLRAVPQVGSTFVRWKGACGRTLSWTIVVGPITKIVAEFAQQ